MPNKLNQYRNRLWLSLWIVGLIWLLGVAGFITGPISLPIHGGTSLVCFFVAYWLNNRIVTMDVARRAGRCPGCNYDLRGINSDKCPECGMKI